MCMNPEDNLKHKTFQRLKVIHANMLRNLWNQCCTNKETWNRLGRSVHVGHGNKNS